MKQKFLILIIACLIINKTKAQLSKQEKDNVIDSAIALMNKAYIFPDVAQNTVAYIRNQQKNKVYDTINDVNAFANKLTADFVKICHDKHVRIFYSADIIPYRQLNKLGMLTLGEWIRSIMHPQIFPVFRWNDPLPSVVSNARLIKHLFSLLLRPSKRSRSVDPSQQQPPSLRRVPASPFK